MSKNSKALYLIGSLRRANEDSSINEVMLTIAPDCIGAFSHVLHSQAINQSNQDILLLNISMNKRFLPVFSKEFDARLVNQSINVSFEYEYRERFIGEFTVFNGKASIADIVCPIVEFNLIDSECYADEASETVMIDNVVLRLVKAPIVRRVY